MHYESDIEGEDGVANNEEVIKSMLSASGADTSKVKVKSWKDLWEQLKDDIVDAHKKQATLTTINQLLLLRNFATLRIKGTRKITASCEIARQWHDGESIHFC